MNWDAFGAVSDALGVAVVVASVWYLAIQVRKQTDEARMTATRELARDWNEIIADLTRDPEFLKLYRKAIIDIEGLADDDRLRVSFFFNRTFRTFEQHFLHLSREAIETPYIDSVNGRMLELMTFPGVVRWWELNRDSYEINFKEYIETLLVEANTKGYDSSFKK